MLHHMYTVGLDVDKPVFTEKILLYAGNSSFCLFLLACLFLLVSYDLFLFSEAKMEKFLDLSLLFRLFFSFEKETEKTDKQDKQGIKTKKNEEKWKKWCSPLVLITFGIIYLLQYSASPLPGQSAGNFGFSTKATAATKNTYNIYTNLPLISEHLSHHKTNLTNDELGYLLAGLIEGNGWFGKKELHIIFSENDSSLAYYIKKRIAYGNVYKIKDKKAVRYICKNAKGLFIILSLINGKLLSNYKYEQLIKHKYSEDYNLIILPPLKILSLDNYWLAGFTQAKGCFHISVAKSKTHKTGYSVRLEYSLKQNDDLPLKLLYYLLKMGNISQYSTGIWCYKSSGFKTAVNLINYFDRFNLFAEKYIDYLKFRKVYIMITEGKHLEDKGIKKIISIATKGSSETSTQEV